MTTTRQHSKRSRRSRSKWGAASIICGILALLVSAAAVAAFALLLAEAALAIDASPPPDPLLQAVAAAGGYVAGGLSLAGCAAAVAGLLRREDKVTAVIGLTISAFLPTLYVALAILSRSQGR